MATTSIAFLSSSEFSFLTDEQFDLLRANGLMARLHEERGELYDPPPIVKLYVPGMRATWLLSSIDPRTPGIAFGLADLGFPEMGFINLDELEELRVGGEQSVRQDRGFHSAKSLSEYARDARRAGHIVT
ncbi:DUF2958 domain-containing protein [Variovorax sp. J22R133]|uniref:DUF2958 domain-containing protein n=1 Tax=Variovorax brevis TaxID=3053503 RepID=UPI002574AB00|nr:DUF2958 domain-containing protein [Variovorax sp. J22R133]MDM0116788.1 DUF2958 domain-containing protein [Variovorax sp. J22R133]